MVYYSVRLRKVLAPAIDEHIAWKLNTSSTRSTEKRCRASGYAQKIRKPCAEAVPVLFGSP